MKPIITTAYYAIEFEGQKIGPFNHAQWSILRTEIDRLFGPSDQRAGGIIASVCAYFRVELKEVLRSDISRQADRVTWPRQVAMYILRATGDYSFMEIGRMFGRDHTTVIHAVNAVSDRCQYPKYQADLTALIGPQLSTVNPQLSRP